MAEYKVRDIAADSVFSEPVFAGDPGDTPPEEGAGFILNAPPLPFSRALRALLLEWEFTQVYSRGVITERRAGGAPGEGPAVSPRAAREQLGRAAETYRNLTGFAGTLFTQISMAGFVDHAGTAEQMSGFVKSVTEDQYFMLKVVESARAQPGSHALSEHAVKSAVISLIIGAQIKLSAPQMTELGVAALLHETEMLYIPPRVYLATQWSSVEDQKLIFTHTALGYKKLSSFGFSPLVCRAVLEHHEAMDGSGYPQRLSGDQISLYARILSCACACLNAAGALLRKDMALVLKEVLEPQRSKYDETVLKALSYAVTQSPEAAAS
ncbi:MAG: HD domain-containing protein [Spirochaetaceae bacterium]|jgi:hypothetical protein|nr:HD domain-containing protein [Spirochaetaceae bacterium]